ncbi:MAG: GNAT family N-acetyltransferase [Oscillospiraceae bacterium]|nr:GNAT family N-acetyltransferase [Oscillospiraceae bacterium]
MLQTKRLTEFHQIEELYRQRMKKDFARNELRPLSSLRKSWEREEYDCFGLYEGDELLGYAFFVRQGSRYLFDYLAIAEEHRDQGYGSAFLRQLRIPEAECIIGEVEDPEKAKDEEDRRQREKRLQFYLRNGYRQTGVTSCVFGAHYRILEVPTEKWHDDGTIAAFYSGVYKKLLPATFYQLQFKLTSGQFEKESI